MKKLTFIEYLKTKDFKMFKIQCEEDLSKAEFMFSSLMQKCSQYENDIEKLNPKFYASFSEEIEEVNFQGNFKESYRKSTHHTFNVLRGAMKNSTKGNKLNYTLAMLVISHVFNHIFQEKESMDEIFKDYFEEKNRNVKTIDYD